MPDEKYTDTGHRGEDPRHGFGDDMGTRVGRPDGAQEAPHDASPGQRPGQPGTNANEVADGIEGSIMDRDGEGEGEEQRRVREASGDVNPDRESGDDRPTFNL